MQKRKLPSPITILMFVIVFAALCTWLIPAGKYDTLVCAEGKSFTISKADTTLEVPFTQATLDSLKIKIALSKFVTIQFQK
jgi:uncharacterized ion transporter superfamily protein YfcC